MRVRLLTTLVCVTAGLSFGGATAPCSADGTLNVAPMTGSAIQTYCVTDFGWSDTWLKGTPSSYSSTSDMFSGEFSPFINYKINGTAGNGSGWISPMMDKGTLNPTSNPSNWTVQTALSIVGTHATSTVQDTADHVTIKIDTFLTTYGVTQTYTITNNGTNALTNLTFGGYWNFHPNSSSATNQGTTSYNATTGTITTTGNHSLGSFLADGRMYGSTLPNIVDIGTVSAIYNAVSGNTLADNRTTVGPSDNAAALVWNLPNVNPGQSSSYTVTIQLVPEPATFGLIGCTLIALAYIRRKRRLRSSTPESADAAPAGTRA